MKGKARQKLWKIKEEEEKLEYRRRKKWKDKTKGEKQFYFNSEENGQMKIERKRWDNKRLLEND